MRRHELSDSQWKQIEKLIEQASEHCQGEAESDLESILEETSNTIKPVQEYAR